MQALIFLSKNRIRFYNKNGINAEREKAGDK